MRRERLRVYTVFRIWAGVTYPDFRYVTRFVQCTCLVIGVFSATPLVIGVFSATPLVDHAHEARPNSLLAIMWRLIVFRALDLTNLHAFGHQHIKCRGCFRICSYKASKNGRLTHLQAIFLSNVQHLWPTKSTKNFQNVSEVTCHVSEAFSDTERGLAGGFQL